MATTTDNGFPHFDAAALPGELGVALSAQFERFARRLMSRAALPSNDSLAGPGFGDLTPGLSHETARL